MYVYLPNDLIFAQAMIYRYPLCYGSELLLFSWILEPMAIKMNKLLDKFLSF